MRATLKKMSDTYYTLAKKGESLFRDRGSKFIGIACQVSSVGEAEARIADIKKEYHDARHHCFAWVIGKDYGQVRANDDGEPGHSAGDPILGQIRSRELTQTLVVVVRYFGGTKLGVPGLVNAYRTAASDALDMSGRKMDFMRLKFRLEFEYDHTSAVMKMVSDHNLELLEQDYGATCTLTFSVRLSSTNEIEKTLREYSERSILLNYHKFS